MPRTIEEITLAAELSSYHFEIETMKYFSFYVDGWLYAQLVTASTIENAEEEARSISAGNHYGLHEITREEYLEIKASWNR